MATKDKLTVESPFKMVLPEKMQVRKDKLEMGLYFYKEAIVLQTFDKGAGYFRMVSPQDVTNALTEDFNFHSEILPENTLWWAQKGNRETVAIWVEPGIRKLAVKASIDKEPARYTIPLPGLIFICQSVRAPWVFAAPERPAGIRDKVYRAPFPNIYLNGATCGGSNKYPENVGEIPDSFFRSFFTKEMGDNRSKKHPNDILSLWKKLEGKTEYPVADLVYHGSIRDLMEMRI